jgi:hypothetical protein
MIADMLTKPLLGAIGAKFLEMRNKVLGVEAPSDLN